MSAFEPSPIPAGYPIAGRNDNCLPGRYAAEPHTSLFDNAHDRMCRIFGDYVNPDGSPVTGSVLFIPSQARIGSVTPLPAAQFLSSGAVEVTLDSTGHLEVDLLTTKDPSYLPADTFYCVIEKVPGGRTFRLDVTGQECPLDLVIAAPNAVPMLVPMPSGAKDDDLLVWDNTLGKWTPTGSLPHFAALLDDRYVETLGDRMKGPLLLAPGDPTDPLQAASKAYVDNLQLLKLRPAVPTASGLPMTGNNIGDVRLTLDDSVMHLWGKSGWQTMGNAAAIPSGKSDGDSLVWDIATGSWTAASVSRTPTIYRGTDPFDITKVNDPSQGYGMSSDTAPNPASTVPKAGDLYISALSDDIVHFTGKPAALGAFRENRKNARINDVLTYDGVRWVPRPDSGVSPPVISNTKGVTPDTYLPALTPQPGDLFVNTADTVTWMRMTDPANPSRSIWQEIAWHNTITGSPIPGITPDTYMPTLTPQLGDMFVNSSDSRAWVWIVDPADSRKKKWQPLTTPSDMTIVATDSDRPTSPREGQAVFNVSRNSIDVWNRALARWKSVGDVPVVDTVADLPSTSLEGDLGIVRATGALYAMLPGGSPGSLAWVRVDQSAAGMTAVEISQTAYDALVAAGTVDANTLYLVTS